MTAPLLIDVFPEFARELEPLLAQEGESELANQIGTLRIYDRFRCGADFCAMIFTQARANRALKRLRSVPLEEYPGILVVDVVDGHIVSIEALFHDELRVRLERLLP